LVLASRATSRHDEEAYVMKRYAKVIANMCMSAGMLGVQQGRTAWTSKNPEIGSLAAQAWTISC
jgi:hypothetical protein